VISFIVLTTTGVDGIMDMTQHVWGLVFHDNIPSICMLTLTCIGVVMNAYMNMYKSYCKTHICCHKKIYSFPQHVATRKLQSYIKRHYPLACVKEQTGKNNVLCHDKITSHPKLTSHSSMLPHCHECMMSFVLCIQFGTTPIPAAACLLTCRFFFTRPFSWHSPHAISQNDSYSITTSVGEFLCIHYQYMQIAKKITSKNKNTISLPFLDF
jgi:hypothetical protein